jgi:hypothetical protein
VEGGHVANQVIGRQDEKTGVAIALERAEGGDGRGRRGVAAGRLEDLDLRAHADLAQLLGDEEAVVLAADDERGCELLRETP